MAVFLLFGFAAVARGFFTGREVVFTLSPEGLGAGTSSCLPASFLDFLGTFLFLWFVCETEYPPRVGCKRILQSGCAGRLTSPTVRPCDTLFFAGSLRRWA